MALINMLMRLKDDGLVINFHFLNSQKTKAKVQFRNNINMTIYMPQDYIIGITAIYEAIKDKPLPNYIVYNSWDEVTEEAKIYTKKKKINLVSYGQFRRILDDILI